MITLPIATGLILTFMGIGNRTASLVAGIILLILGLVHVV